MNTFKKKHFKKNRLHTQSLYDCLNVKQAIKNGINHEDIHNAYYFNKYKAIDQKGL